jgi:2-polyprenylphenol 6-hydroxylase
MRFDVIVVGGGVVGASVARAARGLSVALVAGVAPAGAPATGSGGFDPRVYALSPGSVQFLRSIRVWDAIPRERLTPIRAMRVFGDSPHACIEFDSYRAGVPELAWIVEDRLLHAAIWNALATQDNLELVVPARCASIELGGTARLGLSDGRVLEAELLVGADGADSFVRNAAGIGASEKSYGQTAVVANFACGRPHENAAFQWFQGGPVLALLPLPGDRVSMVWSVPERHAARLMTLDRVSLGNEVSAASSGMLGSLSAETAAQAFPLRRIKASRMVLPHLALAGDAAHVVHPLAGQGLNLGFQDARSLGAILLGREPVRSPGDFALLRRYERDRSEAILAMSSGVHGLQALFDTKNSALRRLRNIGLNLTDRLPVVKNALLRHALH